MEKLFLNIVSLYREFIYFFYGTRRCSWHGNRPFTRRKITIPIMKQGGFHTNNPLWQKLSYQLFLCNLIALWKLINTSSDSFDKTFFTKCSHIIILYTFCCKVSSFCLSHDPLQLSNLFRPFFWPTYR